MQKKAATPDPVEQEDTAQIKSEALKLTKTVEDLTAIVVKQKAQEENLTAENTKLTQQADQEKLQHQK